MMYHQTKFGCQGVNSSETIVERESHFHHMSPPCDLALEDSNNTTTIPSFGKKWLSGSGDIERTRSDTRAELQTDRWADGQSDSDIPQRI